MDRRRVELKGGVAHFKNGNLTQALICFNKIGDASGLKIPERMLLHEYWAATLERLNDLSEALIQARYMIITDETSHKGYLRMGKILRLLGDQENAVKTYEMGLRRAESGRSEIESQIKAVQAKEAKKTPNGIDLFNVLPEGLINKVLHWVQKRQGQLSKVAQTSKLALYSVRTFESYAEYSTLVLLKDMSGVKLKHVLEGRPFCKILVTTAPNFLTILKLKDLPNRFTSIELTGKFGPLNPNPTEYHQKLLSKLTKLKLIKATVTNDDPILFFSKIPSLCGFFAYKSSIRVSQEAQQKFLGKCTTLVADYVEWTGIGTSLDAGDEEHDDKEDFKTPAFELGRPKCFHWGNFHDGELPSAKFLSEVTDLGLMNYYLFHETMQARYNYEKLISLALSNRLGTEYILMSEMNLLTKFMNLKRLDFTGTIFRESRTSQQLSAIKLVFQNLEHLRFNACHPVPKLKFWSMPKLKSCAYQGCDVIDVAQLPMMTQLLSEILICLEGRHIDAKCFQVLADLFDQGRIHVLGVSHAHRLYQSNGVERIITMSRAQPFHHLIIDELLIWERIVRIWPLPFYLNRLAS